MVGFTVSGVEVSDYLTGVLVNFSIGDRHFGYFCRVCL